ncbi:hypothetical protein ACFSWE_03930 [Leucobacter albus]|uniref:Uncharacterized protein n=1 Tax=Leucobacter albus TaxID=272210 RepID=A0ABW3TPN5_9MICO
MGALDRLKQADEQQQTTETLEALTSTVHAVEQQLTTLTKTVADLTGFVKVMDEQQDTRLTRLTSQQPEPVSTQPDDETKKRLSEIEKTLASMAETLSASKTVKLPSGESVKQSDLASYSMMQRIERQITTMSSSADELAEAVSKRGRIVIDPDKLAAHAVKVLDARLTKTVDARLDGLEDRVVSLGTAQAAEAAVRAEQVIDEAQGVVRAVGAAERRVEALSARVSWTAAGRLGLALLPLAAVLLVLGGLTMGVFHALGVGPLLGWAWESFALAELWWQKALIALGAFGGIAGFGWLVWLGARKLADVLRGW